MTVDGNTCVLFGAVITGEGGPVEIGAECVIMGSAVLRGTQRHPLRIGTHVLVGPGAHLSGCTLEDNVFVATGAAVFNGSHLGTGSEVRVHGVVQIDTVVPPNAIVPIGWIAVGDRAEILPPDETRAHLGRAEGIDFPHTVFGLERPLRGPKPHAGVDATRGR